MNVASLALNIPGVIDVCIKLGDHIVSIIASYCTANSTAEDLAHKFDLKWKNILDILEGVQNTESLGDAWKAEIIAILERLRGLLFQASSELSQAGFGSRYNPVTNPTIQLSAPQKLKFATYRKDRLLNWLHQIESWENDIFKRLAVMTLKKHIPQQLAQTVPVLQSNPASRNLRTSPRRAPHSPQSEVVLNETPPANLNKIKSSNIYYSTLYPDILIEFRNYDNTAVDVAELRTNVYGMAKMLKSALPHRMFILKCEGVYPSQPGEPSRFELRYSLPKGLEHPRSLRDLLTEKPVRKLHPLNHRFRLANNLATSVLYVHSGEFVHKRIKPENILLMTEASAPPEQRFPHALGSPFLVGFDRCRPADANSGRYGEIKLHDCLYQHPTRWGASADEVFAMQHDIYSLGVVLLEIGLWQPLVWKDDTDGTYEYADLFASGLEVREITTVKDERPLKVKQRLIEIAKQELPPIVGEIYAKVVLSCLEVHDDGMVGNEDAMRCFDADVGTTFIRHVIKKLESLTV